MPTKVLNIPYLSIYLISCFYHIHILKYKCLKNVFHVPSEVYHTLGNILISLNHLLELPSFYKFRNCISQKVSNLFKAIFLKELVFESCFAPHFLIFKTYLVFSVPNFKTQYNSTRNIMHWLMMKRTSMKWRRSKCYVFR